MKANGLTDGSATDVTPSIDDIIENEMGMSAHALVKETKDITIDKIVSQINSNFDDTTNTEVPSRPENAAHLANLRAMQANFLADEEEAKERAQKARAIEAATIAIAHMTRRQQRRFEAWTAAAAAATTLIQKAGAANATKNPAELAHQRT